MAGHTPGIWRVDLFDHGAEYVVLAEVDGLWTPIARRVSRDRCRANRSCPSHAQSTSGVDSPRRHFEREQGGRNQSSHW